MDTAHQEQEKKDKHVNVVVKYVGEHPFHHDFPPATTFADVELAALRKFEIEPSAAQRYVLVFNDTVMPERGTLKDLERRKVELELRLKEEVPKG